MKGKFSNQTNKLLRSCKNCVNSFLYLIATIILFPLVGNGQITTDVFTSTTTWNCPAGVTTVTVSCWGGGGAGGSVDFAAWATPGNSAAGGGGAGGSYVQKVVTVTPGNTYNVNVAAAQTTSGAAGNDTWFSTTGTVIAKGGAGGQNVTSQTNGNGGTGSSSGCIGDVVYAGGSGTAGNRTGTGGAGGGGAGSTGAGGNASGGTAGTGTTTNGGNGASGIACGSGWGTAGNDGSAGNNYGGGGGGASACCSWCALSGAGGQGAPGYLTITYNGCGTTYSLTSGGGTNAQTVCANTAISAITYSITGSGLTGATVTGLPTGVTDSYGGGVVTISGTPTTAGAYTYTVTATGACAGTPATGTITVTTPPTASAGGSQSICTGDTATVSGASAANGSILWTHNGAGTLINATTTAPSYASDATDAGTTVTLTLTVSAATCPDATATYSVTVTNPPTTPAAITGDSIITCSGTTTLSSSPFGGTWSSSDPSVATVNSTSGKVTAVSSGTTTISYVTGSGNCTSPPQTIDIVVTGFASNVKAVASPNPVCEGDILTLIGSADGGVDAPKSWSWAGPNGFTSNSKNATLSPVTSAAAGTYTLTATNDCGSVVAATSNVIIEPEFNGGAAANSYLVCEGSSFMLLDSTSGANSWYWTGPDNFTSTQQNPTVANATALAEGTYTLTASNTCGSLTVVTDTIKIVPYSFQSTTFTGTGLYTWIAPPGVTSITVEAWGGGGSGSHGGRGTDGGGGGGGAYASSVVTVIPGNSYDLTVGAGGITNCAGNTRVTGSDGGNSSFESAVIAAGGEGGGKVSSTVYTGGAGGSVAASVGTTINPGGDGGCGNGCRLGQGPGNPGSPGTGNSSGGGGGDQYGSGGAGAGAGGQGGTGGYGTADPGSCGVTSPGGGGGGTHTISRGNNNGAHGRVTLTYDYGCPVRMIYGGEETMTSADEVIVCNGSNVNLDLASTKADEFTWEASDNPDVTGETTTIQNSAKINDVLTNNTTTAQIVTYTVTPYIECGNSPHNATVKLDPQIVTVIVNPPNVTMVTDSAKTICSGEAVNLSLAANVLPSTYTWVASNNADVTGESTSTQNTNFINDVLDNTSSSYQIVTYTVTPTSDNGATCVGVPQEVNITIINDPVLSSSTSPTTICSGSAFTYTPTSTSIDSSFVWTRSAVTGINGADTSGIENLYEQLINTTSSAIDVTYEYTTYSEGCTSTENIVVTVSPSPQGSIVGNTRNCGSIGKLTWTATSGTGPFTVEFAPGGETNVTSGVAFDLPANTPFADSIFTLTKVTDANGCRRTDNFTVSTATVTINGLPTTLTSNPVSTTVCEGETATFSVAGDNVGNYTWEESTDGGASFTLISAAGTGPIYSNYTTSDLVVDSALIAHSGYMYRAVLTGGCAADIVSDTVMLTVNDAPSLTSGTGTVDTVCTGDSIKYSPSADIASSTFSWTRPTITGITEAGLTSSGDIAEVLTNTTTSAIDVTYTYVATTPNGCVSLGTGEDVIITVNPDALIELSSANDTDAQHVCVDDTIVPITYTFNEGADSAIVTGLPAGLITSISGNTLTISDTAKEEGYFSYTITTTGSCTQASTITGEITVGLGLFSAVGTDTQTVCKNTAITDIVYYYSGGTAMDPIVTGLPNGITSSASNGVLTISGRSTVDGVYAYTVTTAGSCSPQNTRTGLLTIGIGLVTAGTDTQRVCKNDSIAKIEYFYVGGGIPTVNGLPAGIDTAINATQDTISIFGAPTEEGNFIFEVTTNGSCLQQSSALGKITVGIGIIEAGIDGQIICKSDSIIDIQYEYVGGGTPNIYGLPTGLTTSVSASNDTLTIRGIPTEDGVFTYTVSAQGTCTDSSSLTGTITIGLALVTAGTDAQAICNGDSIVNIEYFVVGDSIPNISGLPTGVDTTFNANTRIFTISGTPAAEGSYTYTVSAKGSCADTSEVTGTITVGLGLVTPGTDSQTICKGDSIVNIEYLVVGDSIPNILGLPLGLDTVFNSSTNLFTISGTPTEEGSFTYTITAQGTCANPSSLSGNIIVGLGLVTPGTDAQNVCEGDSIANIEYVVVGGSIPNIYGLPTGVDTTFNSSTNRFIISGTPTEIGAFTYTVIAQGTCTDSSTLTGNIVIGLGLLNLGADVQSVCKNDSIITIEYGIVGGSDPSINGLPAGLNTNYNSTTEIFTISGAPSEEGTFTYTVTAQGTCTNPSSLTGTITVGLGLANPGTDVQEVCLNTAITDIDYNIIGGSIPTISGLPTGVDTTYNSSTGVYTISGIPTQEGIYTYTVTAQGTCTSASSLSGTITVGGGLDTVSVNGGGSNIQTTCVNDSITPIRYSIVGGSATVNGLPMGMDTTFNSSTNTFIISGTPLESGIFTYSVSTTGTCVDESSFTGTITVDEATATLTSFVGTDTQTVCNNQAITDVTYLIGGTGTNASVVGLPNGLSDSYNSTTGVYTISGTVNDAAGAYTVTVTPSGGGCSSSPETFTVTINNPSSAIMVDSLEGKEPLLVTFTNISSNSTGYMWNFANGITSTAVDTSILYSESGRYTVQLIADANNQCFDTSTITILVYDLEIPNVFSPNGDGINDIFKINSAGIERINVEIYNRWGKKVYEYGKLDGGWDGYNMLNGFIAEEGTYYYIVKQWDVLGDYYEKTGFITLVR